MQLTSTSIPLLIGMVGLALSLGFTAVAFNYPEFGKQELVDLGTLDVEAEEQIEIPPTEQKPPPPPKIVVPIIVEVPDEEEVEEEIEDDFRGIHRRSCSCRTC